MCVRTRPKIQALKFQSLFFLALISMYAKENEKNMTTVTKYHGKLLLTMSNYLLNKTYVYTLKGCFIS